MYAAEVLVHVEQIQRVDVMLQLFRESISQPSEAAHVHAHSQILPLDVGRADVNLIGIANDYLLLDAKTSRGAVPLSVLLDHCRRDLYDLGIVNASSKRIRNGSQIHFGAVRADLDAISQAAFYILKKGGSATPRLSPQPSKR